MHFVYYNSHTISKQLNFGQIISIVGNFMQQHCWTTVLYRLSSISLSLFWTDFKVSLSCFRIITFGEIERRKHDLTDETMPISFMMLEMGLFSLQSESRLSLFAIKPEP